MAKNKQRIECWCCRTDSMEPGYGCHVCGHMMREWEMLNEMDNDEHSADDEKFPWWCLWLWVALIVAYAAAYILVV